MFTYLTILASEEGNGFWIPADIKEVIWGTLAFLIVVGLMVKLTKAPIAKYYNGRIETISEKLNEAEQARVEAESERDRVKAALADSETEKARIIGEAESAAQVILAETESRAAADAEAVKQRAQADLVAARNQAQSDLSGELTRLSFGAAERVVEASLDDAAQQRLIDSYISQVGSQN